MTSKTRTIFDLGPLPVTKKFGERLQSGDRCPDFFFESIDGSVYDLSCFAREKLWLAFYRYGGCPLCKIHFSEVKQIEEPLLAQGVRFVAMFDCQKENVPGWLSAAAKKTVIGVSGDNLALYERFGIEKSWGKLFSAETLAARIRAGLKGEVEENVDGAFNRIPAHFLINLFGEIRSAYYGNAAGDHIPWKEVLTFDKEERDAKVDSTAIESRNAMDSSSAATCELSLAPSELDFGSRPEPDVLFDFRAPVESFDITYRWTVKPGQETEFIDAWKRMQRSIRNKYEGILRAELSRSANGEFISSSKWESRDAWEKFWVTKKLTVREVTLLRFLIQKSTEPEFSLSLCLQFDADNDNDQTHVIKSALSE